MRASFTQAFLSLVLLAGCRQSVLDERRDLGDDLAQAAADLGDVDQRRAPDDLAQPLDLAQPPADLATCSTSFGTELTTTHGRLDGRVVAVLAPGSGPCRQDPSHLHLQVSMNGAIYDVAVAVQDAFTTDPMGYLAQSLSAPLATYAEGWHPGVAFDYPTAGVHAADLVPTAPSALATAVATELAGQPEVAIYLTGYDPSGGHKTHRIGFNSTDGGIVVGPRSATPRRLFFRFAAQSF